MQPTNNIIFNKLNEGRHTTAATLQQLDMFSDIPTPTNTTPTEYWYYSDLHNLFGLDVPAKPNNPSVARNHIYESIQIPKTPKFSRTYLYDSHVEEIKHEFYLQGTLFKNATDLKLSRYACWCLTKNNPHLIYARTYFLAPVILENATYNDIKLYSDQFSRIHLREELKKQEHVVGILKTCGIDYQCFYNNFTKDFFGGSTIEQLKTSCHIPIIPGDALANYMGKVSLQARINALYRTIERFNALPKPQQNSRAFEQIVKSAIAHERDKMRKKDATLPELDLYKLSVSAVESQLKKFENEFIAQYINQKLR